MDTVFTSFSRLRVLLSIVAVVAAVMAVLPVVFPLSLSGRGLGF
jgi:hypothetical protein